jgi:peptidoglycan/LPS O-acetylase OafA/YrhL
MSRLVSIAGKGSVRPPSPLGDPSDLGMPAIRRPCLTAPERLNLHKIVTGGSVPRFAAIEGLRAWLAWAVVASHVILFSGLDGWHPLGWFIFLGGHWAVVVFVMISGFVITHLLIEKAEPYGAYIIRRFMRLFPAFVLATVAGAAGVVIANHALAGSALAALPGYGFPAQVARWREGWFAAAPANILLHATMLHGVVPSGGYAFLPPGWSISLEWQYYLVAPLLLWAVRRAAAVTAFIALVVAIVFNAKFGPLFEQSSALPAMGYYFVIGSVTRLYLRPMAVPAVAPILALGLPFAIRELETIPIAIWCAFMCFLTSEGAGAAFRFVAPAFESRLARYMGERSYSVYVLHFPILFGLLAVGARFLHSQWQVCAWLALTAPPLVLAASALSYRFVERPGIALGHRLATFVATQRA